MSRLKKVRIAPQKPIDYYQSRRASTIKKLAQVQKRITPDRSERHLIAATVDTALRDGLNHMSRRFGEVADRGAHFTAE